MVSAEQLRGKKEKSPSGWRRLQRLEPHLRSSRDAARLWIPGVCWPSDGPDRDGLVEGSEGLLCAVSCSPPFFPFSTESWHGFQRLDHSGHLTLWVFPSFPLCDLSFGVESLDSNRGFGLSSCSTGGILLVLGAALPRFARTAEVVRLRYCISVFPPSDGKVG
jgi:hypothetical protein